MGPVNLKLFPREDFTEKELNKNYTTEELIKTINKNIFTPFKFKEDSKCEICLKNKVSKQFQLSGYEICNECYEKERQKNKEYMLNILNNKKDLLFEGNEIIENKLYLGSAKDAYLKDELKNLGITHILMVGYYLYAFYPNDFTYLNFEVDDNIKEDIFKYFLTGIKFISKSQVCFVHCQWGKSRSSSLVIAYVMYNLKMKYQDAFWYVKRKRNIIFPNDGFEKQLENFDIVLHNYEYDINKIELFFKEFYKGDLI